MKFVMWGIFIWLAYWSMYKPDYQGVVSASFHLAVTLCLYPVFRRQTENQQQQ